MNQNLLLDQEIYVVDNSPEFDDTTFIKIDYFDDAKHEEFVETLFTEADHDMKKGADLKILDCQLPQNDQNSLIAFCNSRVKGSLMRIRSKCLSAKTTCLDSQTDIHQQLFEFIKALTCGVQLKFSKKSLKTQKSKNMRLKTKVKSKKNARLIDYCDSPTCSGSENGREFS